MVAVEWKHSDRFHDWSVSISLPNGRIQGAVSFTTMSCGSTVWGTIESTVGEESEMSAIKYENPPEAIDAVSRGIMTLMADIITRVAVQPSLPPDRN